MRPHPDAERTSSWLPAVKQNGATKGSSRSPDNGAQRPADRHVASDAFTAAIAAYPFHACTALTYMHTAPATHPARFRNNRDGSVGLERSRSTDDAPRAQPEP